MLRQYDFGLTIVQGRDVHRSHGSGPLMVGKQVDRS